MLETITCITFNCIYFPSSSVLVPLLIQQSTPNVEAQNDHHFLRLKDSVGHLFAKGIVGQLVSAPWSQEHWLGRLKGWGGLRCRGLESLPEGAKALWVWCSMLAFVWVLRLGMQNGPAHHGLEHDVPPLSGCLGLCTGRRLGFKTELPKRTRQVLYHCLCPSFESYITALPRQSRSMQIQG